MQMTPPSLQHQQHTDNKNTRTSTYTYHHRMDQVQNLIPETDKTTS